MDEQGRASARVEGEDGALLCGYSGGILAFIDARAFPPGRPLTCIVAVQPEMDLQGRTIGSKKQPDGNFVVRMRLTNLRKAHREALEAMFPPPA